MFSGITKHPLITEFTAPERIWTSSFLRNNILHGARKSDWLCLGDILYVLYHFIRCTLSFWQRLRGKLSSALQKVNLLC